MEEKQTNELKELLKTIAKNQSALKSAIEEHEHNGEGDMVINSSYIPDTSDDNVFNHIFPNDIENIFKTKPKKGDKENEN